MILVIAEKPSVAKNIAFALNANNKKNGYFEGNNYIVTYTFGHLYVLYDVKDYDNNFGKWELDKFPYIPKEFKYKLKNESSIKKQADIIKKLANRNDIEEVIIATDYDREGSLIGDIIIKQLKIDNMPLKRLLINSHTPKEIHKGMNNLIDYKNTISLINAAYCRQKMDWLFGINFSSLTTIKHGDGMLLNIGRVILATTKLVYDRDMEILYFKKVKYYQLKYIFESKNIKYEGYLIDNNNNDKFKDRNDLLKIVDNTKNNIGVITSKIEEKTIENPPLLFNLTDLQGLITSKYTGYTSEKVLMIAQDLYEKKYISYPRTSSRYLDDTQDEEVEEVLNKIKEHYPSDYNIQFKKTERMFNSKKVDSHPAIIPTYIYPDFNSLTSDERVVYLEIVKRFLSHFMPPNEYLNITIITELGDYKFLSKERILAKEGFIKLYKTSSKFNNGNIIGLKKNDISKPLHREILEKETQPPGHYTENTLLKAMENCGKNINADDVENILKGYTIGTPATRADIIKKIIDVGYISRKGKSLYITELGKNLINVFPIKELLSADFTGRIEKTLKDIEKSKVNPNEFMKRMINYTIKCSNILKTTEGMIFDKSNYIKDNTVGVCPECNSPVLVGKYAYNCSNCKFSIWYNHLEKFGVKKISKPNATKLLKKEKVKLRLKSPKTGKDFTCFGYLNKEKDKWSIKLDFSSNK